ncbi:C80 family cysteine peptidase [Roseateles sp.]|uniref:C80 family cysteine peptidase n=1 Tax=Roseateles sp. TaxID=1971397 RepID=UPI002F408CF1
MPVDGTGRVEVVTSLLQAATTSWHAPAGWTDAEKDTLVDAFGVRRFEEFAVGDSRTLSMRPVSETLLAGILDHSVRTLRRAYDLMLRAVRPDQDLAPLHRQAAMVFRLLVDRASAFLADQPGDGQAMVRSLPGRTLAGFYADLLTSAADGTPLTLDFESMRTALDRGYVNDPAATRYCGLVLAMRDQLRLMAATGVIGPVRHAAARVPNDDSGAGWAFDGQRWTTQRDMMAEYWPTAAFDPVSGKVGRLGRKGLVRPWEDFADELGSRTWPDMASRIAANRLEDWADTTADELRSLARKPVADRSAGMGAAAWRRRRSQAQALRDGIHLEGRIDEAVRDYADRLVAFAQAAAEEAATPARQAVFGRGTMPAVDDAAPLPLLERMAPGVSQQLDRDTGVVRLSQGGTAAVWRLPAASGGDAAAHWRLDEALRTVDALVTRDFARGHPSTLETLPRHLTYAAGELRAGSGELLARRLDPSPSDPRPVPEAALDGDSGAMADVSADGSSSSAMSATSLLDRPLARWRNELTARKRGSVAWQALKDQVTTAGRAGKQPRMMMQRVILQMDDSPQAFEASLRHAGRASARGGVLWLQADRRGRERVVAGGELIGTTWAGDRLKLVVVGQGSQQGNGQQGNSQQGNRQHLSGYDGSALATRVEQVLSRQLGSGRPVFGKVTLLACDLEADLPQSRFVPDFVAGFQPALAYDVTAFKGQVLFPVDDPQADGLTQRWTLGEGAIRAMRHAADGAFVTRHVPGAPQQPATPKHAHDVPIVLPTAETLGALDTALDDGVAQAQRLLATIEESLAIYDPALDGRPPEVLRALFTHADGQVDEERLQRVASDPLEQDQLLQDLRRRLATAEPGQVDARSLSRWTGESLAGLVVSMRGHDMSAAFLDSLGARVKQWQSPDMRLSQMLGQERPRDGILQAHRGLTLDAESFQRVLRQLPDEAGSWVRLAAVTDWMSDQGDPAPLFHGQGRAGAMAMAERLARTVFDARNIDSPAIVDLHAAILGGEVGSPGGAGTVPGVGDGRVAAPEYGLLDVLHRALTPAVTEGGPAPWTPERALAWNAKREQLFRLLAADWPVVEQPAMRLALTAAGEELLTGGFSQGRTAFRAAFRADGQGDAIAALPAGPFGDIDRLRIDETTRSAHVPSRSIRRSTRLYLDFLDGMAALIEANPEIASAPWRKAATLRWMRAAMASGLGDAPFLIDIDRIQRDLASSTPAASGRIEALKQGYPALAELSRQGAIGQIRFISSDTARRAEPSWTPMGPQWSWSRVDQMPRLIPDLPHPPAAPAPEDTLRAIFGERRYLVSREQGTLWVPHDGPHGRRTLIHFAPPSEGSPDRLAAQDASLRTLARLLPLSGLTEETIDRWPETMWLDPREFRAGAHVLARATGDGRWTIHRGTVGRLLATFDRPQLSATTEGFTSATNGTNGAGGSAPAVRMEDVVIDRRNLTAWQAALDSDGSARDGHDGRSPAAARDPVPERGLIAYLHETLTRPLPGDAGDVGSRAADAGWRDSATGRRLMDDALLLRWPQLRNIRMLRIVDQQRDAILDGRFPNGHEAFLDALTGDNPQLPFTEGAPGPSRTISASTALYLDFLEEMIRFVDANTPPTPDLQRQSPRLRLMREALTSGLKRTPFLIDLDGIQPSPTRRLPDGEAHINVLKQSYRALTELARQGAIGEIRFTSSDPAHRADPRWTPIDEQRSWSGDDPLQRLFTDLAPLPLAQSAEDALAAVGIAGRSRLDRAAGTLRVATGTPGELDTVIRFSPLPADASPDLRAGQDRQLLTLARLLRLSGLADTPVRHWPTALSIGQDEFKAGSLLVARDDGTGRWTVDDTAQRRLLRIVPRARDAAWSAPRPASVWKDYRPVDDGPDHPDRDLLPKFDPRAVRDPDLLRIYVALQDDRVIDQMGHALSRKYDRGVVLVRLAEDGSWTITHGRELLNDVILGKRPVRLILGGHGQVDPVTKATRLATYTPERIATSIGRLLAALRPGVTTKVEGTRILSCALETPTAEGSFGRAFAQAADTAGWAAPGMRTTVYSDLLVHQLHPASSASSDDDHFFTRIDQEGQDVRRAAGVTWQFWLDNGEVQSRDKYPEGGQGQPIENEGPRSIVGDTEGAASRVPLLTTAQHADQARRVRRVLEVFAQLRQEAPIAPSQTTTMSDAVMALLMARVKTRDVDLGRMAVMRDIADHLSQGLLGDATPLRRAYAAIDLVARGESPVAVSRHWLARADDWQLARTVVNRLDGVPARISGTNDLFLEALSAARDSLFEPGQTLRPSSARTAGRITLFIGALGAAASDGTLHVDLSRAGLPSGARAEADVDLVRALPALSHLRDIGALRALSAVSIDAPGAAPRPLAEGWRYLGDFQIGPTSGHAPHRGVSVRVAPLTGPLVAAGLPHVGRFERAGRPSDWGSRSRDGLGLMIHALEIPFDEALDQFVRLPDPPERPGQPRDGQVHGAVRALINDLGDRLLRMQRHNAPAWTYDSFQREVLDARTVPPLRRDAVDADDFAALFADLGPAESEYLSSAMEIHRRALQRLADRIEDFRKIVFTPGTSLDAVDLLADDAPFAALLDRAPQVRQSLDRAQGVIRLRHEHTATETTVSIDPLDTYGSDDATPRAAMVRQDADIRTAEALIISFLQASPDAPAELPQALGELPRRMSLLNGEFSVNDQVVAWRRDGAPAAGEGIGGAAWGVDRDAVSSALRALHRAPRRTPLTSDPEAFGLSRLPEPAVTGAPPRKLKLIVQLDGDRDSTVAAWLLARKHADNAVWLQMEDPPGVLGVVEGPRITTVVGERLYQAAGTTTDVDILVIGHSGMSSREFQHLSGWGPGSLSTALRTRLFNRDTGLMPTLRRVSLVSCDLQAPSLASPFAVDFLKGLAKPGWTADADVTARTGHVHVAELDSGDGSTRIMKMTSRLDPEGRAVLRHRMPQDTMLLTLDRETGAVYIVDRYADPDVASSRSWARPADELRLMFDSVLGGTVPTPLIELFTGADGQVDEARMRRVAGDPVEVHQLADDLARAVEEQPQHLRDDGSTHALLDASLAGRVVTLQGRELSAQFLHALGARIDGEPLTAARLAAIDPASDLAGRLTLAPTLFEQMLPLLPAERNAALRLDGLAAWLRARASADLPASPFHGVASARAMALATRLAAVPVDARGHANSEELRLAALRPAPETTASGSLMSSILGELSQDTLAFFDGLDIDAIKALPVASDASPHAPLERVMAGIALDGAPGIQDPWGISAITQENALADLREQGLVTLDGNGVARLDEAQVTRLVAGDADASATRAATALLSLPEPVFARLSASHGRGVVRRFINHARAVRAALLARLRGIDLQTAGNHGFGVMNTLIGAWQLREGWKWMDATTRGLSVVQTGSIVITPAIAKIGEKLLALGPVARNFVTRTVATMMKAGATDIIMSGIALYLIGKQWEEFHKGGLSTDSYQYKSLVANTTMTVAFTVHSLAATGTAIGAALVPGALSGTLGTLAGVLGSSALPVGIASWILTGSVNAFQWAEEYGDFLRASDQGDVVGATLLKIMGFQPAMFQRAEVEKGAAEAAAARAQSRRQGWAEHVEFRADQLAKVGYGSIRSPDLKFEVAHATFRVPDQDPPYSFVLQDRRPRTLGFKETRRDPGASSGPVATAWIGLSEAHWIPHPATDARGGHLFELQGSTHRYQVSAGADADRFLLDGHSRVEIFGGDGVDEVVIDASGRHLVLLPRPTQGWKLGMGDSPALARTMGSELYQVEKFTVRNALSVDLQGGDGDQYFDVAASTGVIAGGGGRNTYVLHTGVRIRSTSDDALVWNRGVTTAVELAAATPTHLMLKVDVLHEALSMGRTGDDLSLRCGADALTLSGFFTRSAGRDSEPSLVIVDALGTPMTLADPRGLSDQVRPSTSIDHQIVLAADTVGFRRTLGGTQASTRYHLMAGAGAFRTAPRSAIPLDIVLDVVVARLRYRRDGAHLLIEEIPPGDAAPGYTPLRLTLTSGAASASGDSLGRSLLWARADAKTGGAVLLHRPRPDDPDEGPMRVVRDGAVASPPQAGMSETPSIAAAPAAGRASGSGDADVLDAGSLPDALLLSGGEGSDTYRIPAGRSIVIDNTAIDGARDFLELDIDPALLRFRREGDDLIVDTGSGSITLRGHAVDLTARHLSLTLPRRQGQGQGQGQGGRYALPVILDSGLMMYGDDPADGSVPGFVPGRHLVLATPGAAWMPRSRFVDGTLTRKVALGRDASFLKDGASLLLSSGAGAGAAIDDNDNDDDHDHDHDHDSVTSKVYVLDYYRRFGQFEIDPLSWQTAPYAAFPSGDWLHPLLPDGLGDTWRRYQALGAPAAMLALLQARGIVDETQVKQVSRVARILFNGTDDGAGDCDPAAVRLYLQLMGLPAPIAGAIRSTRPAHLRRLRDLLHVASAAGVTPPANFLDAYAASDVGIALSPERHGALLRHLAADGVPWAYAERVLSFDLPLEAIRPLEAWMRARPGNALDRPQALDQLDEFARLLGAGPEGALVPTAHTAALLDLVLRIRGRPADVATALATAMVALGTLDEAWIDGMQRAGVVDHGVLARLHRAKVPVQDLVIGNAHRLRYEDGDRRWLIDVGVSPDLRQPASKVFRNELSKYLALDGDGNGFMTQDTEAVPGRTYDLVPGEVLDQWGQSPDTEKAKLDWELARMDLEEEYEEKHADQYWKLKISRNMKEKDRKALEESLANGKASYVKRKSPPLSALSHLKEAKLIETRKSTLPGPEGFGRSTLDNLVDGAYAAGEATAWRPVDGFSGRTPQFLQFDFAHAVALDGVELRYTPGPLDSRNVDWSLGLWKLQALTDRARWLDVSREDHVLKGTRRHFLRVDTGGVPYRSYRLSAVDPFDGCIAADSWFNEVSFTTTEAGLSPMITRLMAAGYSREDSDALMARGVVTEAAVARAVEIRRRLGEMPAGLLAEDIVEQPALTEATWSDLDRLRPFVAPAVLLREARQGWSAGSLAHLLADSWPRPASMAVIDRGTMAPVLHDALSSWRLGQGANLVDLPAGHDAALVQAVLDAATGDTRALARALHLPGWRGRTLGGQRAASRPIHLDAPRLNELLSPPSDGTAMPTARFDAPFLLAADAFIHLVKALHRRLVLDGDEQPAIQASTPALLQLLAVTARTSGLALTLARPTGHFPSGESLRAAVDGVSRHLSQLGMTGVLKVGPILDMDLPGSADATAGPLHKALTLIEGLGYDKWGLDRFPMDALARRRLDVKKRLMAAIFKDAELPAAPHLEDLADLILRSVACEPDALPLALKLAAGLLHRYSAKDSSKDSAEAGREAMLLVGKTMKTVIDGWRKGRDGLLKRYDARVSVAPEGMADILVAAALDVPYEFHLPQQARDEIAQIVLVMRDRSARQIQAVRDAGLLKVTVLSETRPRHGILVWRQREESRQWTTEAPLPAVFREPGLYLLSLGMTPDRIEEILDAGMRSPDEIDRFLQFQSTVMKDAPLAAAWARSDPRPPLDHAATLWIPRLHGLGVATSKILDIVSNGVSDTERALVLIDHLPYDTWGGSALVAADLAPLRDDIQRSVSPWMSPEASSSFSGLLVRAICGDRAALRDAVRLAPDLSVLIEAAQGLYEKVLTLSVGRLGEEQAAEAAMPFALTLQTLSEVQRDKTLYVPADGHDSPREIGEARVLARAAPQLQRLVDVGILRAQGIYETEPLGDDHVPFDLSGTTPTWRSSLPLTRVLTGPTTSGPVTQASLLSQAMATSGAAASPPAASQAMPRREVASAMLAPQAA